MEVKQWSCLTEQNLESVILVSTLLGPVTALISLDSERLLLPPSVTFFRKQQFTFTSDGSSSPWTEGSSRLYICLMMAINSALSCDHTPPPQLQT